MAQTLTWNGGTDDWNTATDWTPNAVPQTGDTAIINSGTAELVGTSPADGVTLSLDGTIGAAGTTVAALLTQGTNIVFGNGFTIVQTLTNSVGELETSGTTTFEGTLVVGSAASLGTANIEAFAIGVDSYESGIVSGDFINAGLIGVGPGGVLEISNLAPESPGGGSKDPPNVSPIGGGTVQFNAGQLVVDGGVLITGGSLPLQSGTIAMVHGGVAIIGNARAATDIAVQDGNEIIEIPQAPGLLTDYSMAADITGFQQGDRIVLDLGSGGSAESIGSVSYDATNQILSVVDPNGTLIDDINMIGTFAADAFRFVNTPATGSTDAFGTIELACFAAGTHILTPNGERRVEDLREGDLVFTATGEAQPIVWIGRSRVDCRRHARPEQVTPVRIRAGAFAVGVPARDFLLSPGHAVFAEGVLIPVSRLVNGVSIAREENAAEVTYYHIELPLHDILLAEGLPTESYLDDGNRAGFANGGAYRLLHADYRPKSWDNACAPMRESGPEVALVKQRLRARLQELGYEVQSGTGIELWAGGIRIEPRFALGGLYHFMLPAEACELRIVSPRGVPSGLFADSGDGRWLGAQLALVLLDGAWVPLDSPILGSGFHGIEQDAAGSWRWTDGAGHLHLPPAQAPRLLELFVRRVMRSWTARQRPASEMARQFSAFASGY